MSEENNAIREEFERWLRTVCFQKPTKEAKSLAWSAWKEMANKNTAKCKIGYPECQRNWNENAKCFYGDCDD